MKEEELDDFIQRLEQEKKALIAQVTSLERTGLGSAMGESISELSCYDNHPADIGDELFERSKDIALRDNAHILLEQVEHVLQKIEQGTYEICDKCQQSIPVARLSALPWASECIACQRADDASDDARRPLEEEILKPPFQRSFLDHSDHEFVGFDREDALQAVMSYGSSDSPQDVSGSHDYKDLFLNSNEEREIVDATDGIPDDIQLAFNQKKYQEKAEL